MILNKMLKATVLGLTVCAALAMVACGPKEKEAVPTPEPLQTPVAAQTDAPQAESEFEPPIDGVIEIPEGAGELDEGQALENESIIMNEFASLTQTALSPLELSAFVDQYSMTISADNALIMAKDIVASMQAKIKELEPTYKKEQKNLAKALDGDLSEQKATSLTDEALIHLLVEETFQNGLMLVEKDKQILPAINPAFVAKYTTTLTPSQQTEIDQLIAK